jgi:hypothetical protein
VEASVSISLFALLIALLPQEAQAAPFTSIEQCVEGREVEARPTFEGPLQPRRPGVIVRRQSDPRSGRCLIGFVGPVQGDWVPFQSIYPRSARAQATADAYTASTAAAAQLPPRLQDARRLFLSAGPQKCHYAASGIAAGPDLAREVLNTCGYIPADWDRAQAMNPLWDMTAMRAEGAQLQAQREYDNAVIREHIQAQEAAAQAARDRRGPERTYGSGGAYAGSTSDSSTSSTAGAYTPPTVSETAIRETMAREACFENVNAC